MCIGKFHAYFHLSVRFSNTHRCVLENFTPTSDNIKRPLKIPGQVLFSKELCNVTDACPTYTDEKNDKLVHIYS